MCSSERPLIVADLLHDLDDLTVLLVEQLRGGTLLDAYLLACGMNQIVEDYRHRDLAGAIRVSRTLAQRPQAWARWGGAAAGHAYAAGLHLEDAIDRGRRVARWQGKLALLVKLLAGEILATSVNQATAWSVTPCRAVSREGMVRTELQGRVETLQAALERLPGPLRRSVVRLPTCFRSLDQRPEDCLRLIQSFASRRPDRRVPLLVVGLRTSGSYLAPLYAAALANAGYLRVEAMTYRPQQRLLPDERQRLRCFAGNGGVVLLADDPPRTGESLMRAAGEIERLGISRRSIVLLVPLAGPRASLPERLRPFESAVLPWEHWSIQDDLAPAAVKEALEGLLTEKASAPLAEFPEACAEAVRLVERLDLDPITDAKSGSPLRRHVRARYRVLLVDRETGVEQERVIYAKGTGLGYFGRHSLAVAGPLAGFLPEVYGLRNGLLFRAWLPGEFRLAPAGIEDETAVAARVASYAVARSRALATPEDRSMRVGEVNPLWRRGAQWLSAALGPAALPMRPLLEAMVRRLLFSEHPSVIDGSMALSQWFQLPAASAGQESADTLVKVDFDERAFSSQDTLVDEIYCYDAAYDVAAAAADYEMETSGCEVDGQFTELVRRHYEVASGRCMSEEQWLLYRSLATVCYQRLLKGMLRQTLATPAEGGQRGTGISSIAGVLRDLHASQRALARFQQRYAAQRFLADLAEPTRGAWCALDLDGVLEDSRLGFPAMTPAACLSLRALMKHGYRPLLATGRSLAEVQERCLAYRLAGGVAEYGAVTYEHASRRVCELLTDGDRWLLDQVRSELLRRKGVYLDSDYTRAIRAYQIDSRGHRCRLDDATVQAVLGCVGALERVRPIHGGAQSDFMVLGVDKGKGLRALLDGFSEPPAGTGRLALAVGDTRSDLPMFELAGLACAPGSAEVAVRTAGIRCMERPGAAGLAEAVGLLIGHQPGACSICHPPERSQEADLLLSILAAQDGSKRDKLAQIFRLLKCSRG